MARELPGIGPQVRRRPGAPEPDLTLPVRIEGVEPYEHRIKIGAGWRPERVAPG